MSVLKIHMTYGCTAACDHCRFGCSAVPGKVIDTGMAMECIRTLQRMNGLQLVVLMGGEPGLCREQTQALTEEISGLGINVRIETNGFWAADDASAMQFLEPLCRCHASVMFSLDAWHERYVPPERVIRALKVMRALGGETCIESAYLDWPACWHAMDRRTNALLDQAEEELGGLPKVYRGTMLFNGRASRRLAGIVSAGRGIPTDRCTCVPWWSNGELGTLELLELDPEGYLSKGCGIAIGSIRTGSTAALVRAYQAESNPVFSTLMSEGPAGLAREAQEHGYILKTDYADKCHLCQEARMALVEKYPAILTPSQHYRE